MLHWLNRSLPKNSALARAMIYHVKKPMWSTRIGFFMQFKAERQGFSPNFSPLFFEA